MTFEQLEEFSIELGNTVHLDCGNETDHQEGQYCQSGTNVEWSSIVEVRVFGESVLERSVAVGSDESTDLTDGSSDTVESSSYCRRSNGLGSKET